MIQFLSNEKRHTKLQPPEWPICINKYSVLPAIVKPWTTTALRYSPKLPLRRTWPKSCAQSVFQDLRAALLRDNWNQIMLICVPSAPPRSGQEFVGSWATNLEPLWGGFAPANVANLQPLSGISMTRSGRHKQLGRILCNRDKKARVRDLIGALLAPKGRSWLLWIVVSIGDPW